MLFRRIHERDEIEFQAFVKISAAELGLAEKDLEDLMSRHPTSLFGGEGGSMGQRCGLKHAGAKGPR